MEKIVNNGDRDCTVILDDTECSVKFDSCYRAYSVQNNSISDVFVSIKQGANAGDDGVMRIKAGCSAVFAHMRLDIDTVYFNGTGEIQVHGQNDTNNSFRNAPVSGGGAYERYYVYNNGVELNGHTLTIYHKSDSSKKDTNWIYINGFYLADISSDKIINNGYSKLCVNVMSDSTKWNYTPKYLKLLCTDESAATLSVNDYSPNGNVLKSLDIISYPDTVRAGTIYKLDVSDLSEFYVHLSNVNADTYILGVWLEREERAKGSMNFDKWGHTSGSTRYTIDNNGWVSNFYNSFSYVGVAKSFAYTKSFEIMMNFILDTLPARPNVLFGSSISNNFYLAPTLEVQRNAAWAGLSYNGTSWDKNISYNITWETNKEYYLKYSFDVLSKTLKLELSYDGINWNKIAMATDVEIGYQGKDTEYLEIGGIAQSSNHYFVCGKINIFKSYIKTDDELFWGVQYE